MKNKTEWECIDLRCTHWDGDMCRHSGETCEPDIFKDKLPLCAFGLRVIEGKPLPKLERIRSKPDRQIRLSDGGRL